MTKSRRRPVYAATRAAVVRYVGNGVCTYDVWRVFESEGREPPLSWGSVSRAAAHYTDYATACRAAHAAGLAVLGRDLSWSGLGVTARQAVRLTGLDHPDASYDRLRELVRAGG